MCRASGDATPTSTANPPPPSFFLLLSHPPSLRPSFLSFHVPAFSPHLPSPRVLFHPTSFPPLLLLLAACVRSHAKRIATLKLNRGNATWTTAAVSCTRIRSLCLSLVWGHMPRMCRHFLRWRGSGGFGIFAREPVDSWSLIRGPLGSRMLDDEVRLFRRKMVGIRGGVEIFLS